MNQTRMNRSGRTARSRRRTAFELIEESLELERKRHDPEWSLLEDERLTRVRIALFGCAPK